MDLDPWGVDLEPRMGGGRIQVPSRAGTVLGSTVGSPYLWKLPDLLVCSKASYSLNSVNWVVKGLYRELP